MDASGKKSICFLQNFFRIPFQFTLDHLPFCLYPFIPSVLDFHPRSCTVTIDVHSMKSYKSLKLLISVSFLGRYYIMLEYCSESRYVPSNRYSIYSEYSYLPFLILLKTFLYHLNLLTNHFIIIFIKILS